MTAPIGNRKVVILLLASFMLVGGGIRFYKLGEKCFWVDEVVTAEVSKGTWEAVSNKADSFGNPPAYYLLVKPFRNLRWEEWGLRFPSALFGLLTVPAMFFMVLPVGNRPAALSASFFTAVSYFHFFHSQDARQYATVMFLATVFCALVFRVENSVAKGSRPNRVLFWATPAVGVAGVYLHYFLLFMATAAFLYLAWIAVSVQEREKRLPSLVHIVLMGALALILSLPLLLGILTQSGGFTRKSERIAALGPIANDVVIQFGAGNALWSWCLALAVGLGWAFGARTRRPLVLCVLLVAFPALCFSIVMPDYFFFAPRWLCFLFPLYAAGLGLAASLPFSYGRKTRTSALLATTLTVAFALPSLPSFHRYYQYEKTAWREAVEVLAREMRDGDVLVGGFAGTNASLALYIAKRPSFPKVIPVEKCTDLETMRSLCRNFNTVIYYVSTHRSYLPEDLVELLESGFEEVADLPAIEEWGHVHIWRRKGLGRTAT